MVRELFADDTYVRKHNLASPSSLNFGRILIQMVHFFYTYLKVCLNFVMEKKDIFLLCEVVFFFKFGYISDFYI